MAGLAGLKEYGILLVASWTAGISVYLTAALLGIGDRAGWIELPGSLDALSNPFIIALALILYACEFAADKVPFVDSAWDSVHTLIRPLAAAGAGVLAGTELGPVVQTGLALAMGTITLDAHAVKASTRVAINTSPEPFSNIAASLAEHGFVIFLLWFFVKHPVIACALVVLLIIGSFFFLRMMWRFVLGIFRGFRKKETVPPPEKVHGNS